jgi:hypothetical protein
LIAPGQLFASKYKDFPALLFSLSNYLLTMDISKANTETVENAASDHRDEMPVKIMGPIMRSREDDLGIWQCVRRFKTVSLIAMAAAFSASLDGYRK